MSCSKFLSNNNIVNDLLVPSIPKGQKELFIDPDYLLTLLQSLIKEYNGNWVSFTKSLYPLQSVSSVYIHNFESFIPIPEHDNDEYKLYNYIVHNIEMKQENEVDEQVRKEFVASCSELVISSEEYVLLDVELPIDLFNSLTMCVLRKLFRCLATALGKTENLLFGDAKHHSEFIQTLQTTDLSHQNLDYLEGQGNYSQDQLCTGMQTWNICFIELLPAFTHLRRIIVGHLHYLHQISALLRTNAETLELFLVTNVCGNWTPMLTNATQNIVYPRMTYFNAGFDESEYDFKQIETVISAFPQLQTLYLYSHFDNLVPYRFEFWELVFTTLRHLQIVNVCSDQLHEQEWTTEQQQRFSVWKQTLVSFQTG